MRATKWVIVGTTVALAAVLGMSGLARAASITVTLTPTGAQPPRVSVSLGDTVTIVNSTPEARVLKSNDEAFPETTIPAGGTYAYVATDPGNIAYRFGTAGTDRGSITVKREGSVTLASKIKVVTFGTSVTLSGLAVPAGFPVAIEGQGPGTPGWEQLTTATPASGEGAFVLQVKPLLGTQYRASLFDGVIRSPRVIIQVRPSIRLASSARKSRTDRTVKLRASVQPRDAASRITLSAYSAQRKSWRRVSSQRLRNGRALIAWKVEQGKTRLRLSIDRRYAKQGLESAVSNVIPFTGVGESSEPSRVRDRDRDRNRDRDRDRSRDQNTR